MMAGDKAILAKEDCMKFLLAAALSVALTGCVTSEPPAPDMTGINPEHDAYCRGLMMPPGTLVYVQCRLAMSETLREAEAAGRSILEADLGPLSPEIDTAMRSDVFCNLNESTKLSMEPGTPAEQAFVAQGWCTTTRNQLQAALLGASSFPGTSPLADYDSGTIATNEATIAEARAFR